MRRTGKVAAINPRRGMVAISTPDDGFTIVELISSWEPEIGDEIAWSNGYGLGSETYENLTQGRLGEVFVQNHAVNQANLRAQLLL